MQNIDVFINGLEILIDRDLQTSMNLNMVSINIQIHLQMTIISIAEPLLELDNHDARHYGQKQGRSRRNDHQSSFNFGIAERLEPPTIPHQQANVIELD